jgi:hypothetical protein
MNELKRMWAKLLGTVPSNSQFEFWAAAHSPETVQHGILKTAQKNLTLGGTMSDDHKIRFASKVMLSSTRQKLSGHNSEETRTHVA